VFCAIQLSKGIAEARPSHQSSQVLQYFDPWKISAKAKKARSLETIGIAQISCSNEVFSQLTPVYLPIIADIAITKRGV
jgi:hypothetical protein